jgi:hypothetical protein
MEADGHEPDRSLARVVRAGRLEATGPMPADMRRTLSELGDLIDWLGAGHASQCITPALPSTSEMTDTTGKIAKNLERFAQAVAAHDRENPTHTANGIGLAHFDLERLGLEEGEEILPGITIHADSGVTGNFRVLCDGEHDEGKTESEKEVVEVVATQAVPVAAPGISPSEIPFGG